MAAIRVKSGGTTWTGVGNGKAWVKWGGAGWTIPQRIKAKQGALGAGSWADSTYTGQPSTPSVPWVSAWDYNNVIFNWNAGGGGVPVAYYRYILDRTNDGARIVDSTTTATSIMIGINWDCNYLFYVQAVGINGVATGWANNSGSTQYGRVGIGHPYQPSYGYVQHVTGWDSGNLVNVNPARDYLFRDEAFSVYVGDDVVVKGFSWGDLRVHIGYVGNIVTTGFARTVNALFAGVWQGWALDDGIQASEGLGETNILSSSSYAWYQLPVNPPGGMNGGNNWWGIGPRGEGWHPGGGSVLYAMYASAVNFYGDRYYTQWELTSAIGERGNFYW